MKKSELQEVKKTNLKELADRIKSLRSEVAGLYLDKNMSKLSNLKMIKNKRKELAQLLTIKNQKETLEKLEGKKA